MLCCVDAHGHQLQLQCTVKHSLTFCISHRSAYNVACLGVTENDWMVLAMEAFEVGQAAERAVQFLTSHAQ